MATHVYQYVADGQFSYPGVPMRDIDGDEAEERGITALLDESPHYKKVRQKPAPAAPESAPAAPEPMP